MKSEGKMGNVMMQRSAEGSDQHIVFLGNLPFRARWQDLKDLVRSITPNIERAEIYLYPDGKSRGHGYVRIRGREEAERASSQLNGYDWEGRALITKMMESGCCPIVANGPLPNFSCHQGSTPNNDTKSLAIDDLPDCYLPYLPPEYLDQNAMARAIPLGAKPYDVCSQQAGINMQAHLHYHASATSYGLKAEQALVHCEEARLVGNFGKVNEFHRLYAFLLEKQTQVLSQACLAFQLAQEQIDKANQLRRAEGLPELPRYTIQPYPIVPPTIPAVNGYGALSTQVYAPAITAVMVPPLLPPQGLSTFNGYNPSYSPSTVRPEPMLAPHNAEYIHVPPAPVVVTPPNGLPVNLSHGAVQTECRGIFVGNLHFETTWREVKDYFRSCGKISRVEIPLGVDGKPKGHAIILFENAEDAEKACLRIDGSIFKGRQLRVRMDKHCNAKRIRSNWQSRTNSQRGRGEDVTVAPEGTKSSRSGSTTEGSVYKPPIVVNGSFSSSTSS